MLKKEHEILYAILINQWPVRWCWRNALRQKPCLTVGLRLKVGFYKSIFYWQFCTRMTKDSNFKLAIWKRFCKNMKGQMWSLILLVRNDPSSDISGYIVVEEEIEDKYFSAQSWRSVFWKTVLYSYRRILPGTIQKVDRSTIIIWLSQYLGEKSWHR